MANFGRRKVAVACLCTFDHRFRMAELGRTVMVMGGCNRKQWKLCWRCFLGCFEGDSS